jgi:large subunit ribosomal protein L21
MYAIIKSGGKQYKVSPGDLVRVEKLEGNVHDTVVLDEVLAVNKEKIRVGRPYVTGVTVTGEISERGKEKKIIVFKSKRRKGYRKKQGHRQAYTALRIKEIKG